MRISFLTRSLRGGGAERQVGVLAAAMHAQGHDVAIVPFYAPGPDDAPPAGVRVRAAGKRGRWDVLPFLLRLIRILRSERPDILHSYLPVANLLAALLRPLLPRTRIVWGMRASTMELKSYDWLSRLSFAAERRLAGSADLIIANADAVRYDAAARGYPVERIRVVPNGIDVAQFTPDPEGGAALRRSCGIAADAIVIGVVGRLDPMKDHETFFRALALLTARHADLRAILVGEGSAGWSTRLRARAAECGVADRLAWTGWRQDMRSIYGAMDVLCLPSAFGEGFPNVVGEAMACAVPCVVTDVGDAAAVVGGTGRAAPPRDAAALAAALETLIALPRVERRALGAAARARIIAEYDVARLVTRTVAALEATAGPVSGRLGDASSRRAGDTTTR